MCTFIPWKPVPSLPSYDSSRYLLPEDESEQTTAQPEIWSPQIAAGQKCPLIVPKISDTEKPFTRSKRLRSHLKFHQSWWKYEILAATISILSTAALISLLYHYHGTAARRLGHGITLNGVVANLATTCRTYLMIPVASGLSQGKWLWFSVDRAPENGRRLEDLEVLDDASRGSWGSLELFWTLKGRAILSLGAVITILALAFNALTQQVLATQYTNTIDNLASPSELDVPRNISCNLSRIFDNCGENKVPDWSTYSAISNGMLATNMSHLPASYTTGNCTWPITPSLGVCGECQPVKWSAPENCTGSTYDSSSDRSCIYTLPDEKTLRVGKGDHVNIFQVSLSNGVAYNASSTTIPYILNFEVSECRMVHQPGMRLSYQLKSARCGIVSKHIRSASPATIKNKRLWKPGAR